MTAAALPFVNRSTAMRQRTHHQFISGVGYLAHSGPPDLPEGANGSKNCAPPHGTRDGSRHVMAPPSGPLMTMIWVAAESAWSHPIHGKGNRLAWTPDHLSRAGWGYVGAEKKSKTRPADATVTRDGTE